MSPPAATMTCGKLHVRSCSLLWFLSSVYLVYNTVPKATRAMQAEFNLVVQRPRFAGSTLIIPIDATVRLVKCSGREGMRHTIRLRYGATGARKCLVMRASSSLEREQWLAGIREAVTASKRSAKFVSAPGSPKATSLLSGFAIPVIRHEDKRRMPSPVKLTTKVPQSRPKCSLQQTVPAVMQFFIAIGQIIASAS